MFGRAYGWPRQSYRSNPAPTASAAIRPYNLQPVIFQRGVTITGNFTQNDTDSSSDDAGPAAVCHVDLKPRDGDPYADAELDYDDLLFVDMDGNRVDGRTCRVIYEDHPDSQLRIVIDQDGNMVDMYIDNADDGLWHAGEKASVSSFTGTAEPVIITVTTGSARPGSGEPTPTFPISTMMTTTKSGSVITLPPL